MTISSIRAQAKRFSDFFRRSDFAISAFQSAVYVTYLQSEWPEGLSLEHNQTMVADLTSWWNEWAYAWDHSPKSVPRQRFRSDVASDIFVRTAP